MYDVRFTKPAREDFKKAALYICRELQNPVAADNFIRDIEDLTSTLSEMPHRNPLVRDKFLATQGFRSTSVKNYLVFYVVSDENKSVTIHRILYGRRDWRNLI